jgi:hypothetical protein
MNDQPETSRVQFDLRVPPASVRASDGDRERTAGRLRHAAGEGRLRADELEQRLDAAFSATTCGQLDRLVRDLPIDPEPRRRRSARLPLGPAIVVALAAVLATVVLIAAVAGLALHRSSAAARAAPRPCMQTIGRTCPAGGPAVAARSAP